MSTENSLEDMVEKTLESAGVLSKMRAELRASVFHILEKGSSFQDTSYSDTIKEFTSNDNGLLLMSLIKDLFEYLDPKFTASVFDSETGARQNYFYKNKDEIYKEVLLPEDVKRPILLQILEFYKVHKIKDVKIVHESNSTESNDLSLGNTSSNHSSIKLDNSQKNIDFNSSVSKSDNEANYKNHLDVIISDNPTDNESTTPLPLINVNEENNSESRNNQSESSLDDIETDENMTVGNDSIQSSSTDLSLGKIAS